MNKKVLSYILVAIVAFALGTLSSLNAEGQKNADTKGTANLEKKIDKVLANQDQILRNLQLIKNRV